jgi:hypothetical protein
MMQNHVRSNARLTGATALALAQLVVVACDSMPLAAPTASTVSVTSAALVLPTGGTTEISAFVAESSGTPVQNGTTVRFSTSLGSVTPVDAQTRNGIATTIFHAGDTSGVAEVRATSGSAGGASTGTGTTTTSSNMVQISVGAAAVDSVTLRANPSFVQSRGGTVELVAGVVGVGGRAVTGVPVTFSTTEGTLGATRVISDEAGEARTTLTTERTASVTASAGTKTSPAVTVTRRDPPPVPTVTLAGTAGAATVNIGQLWTFTATVAGTDANTLPQRFKWNFGDDTEAVTNGNTTSHVYTQPLVRRVVTVEVTMSNGETISATTEIIVGAF